MERELFIGFYKVYSIFVLFVYILVEEFLTVFRSVFI